MNGATILKTLGLVLSLGLDTLAVAVSLGMSGLSRRDRFRYGVTFATAEGLMPLVGFLLGLAVATAIGHAASYATIVVLCGVGLYTIWEASHDEERTYEARTLLSLLLLAVSVSLDELAVGFSLGLLHIPLLLAISLIALQAFTVTLLGTKLGSLVKERVAVQAGLLSGFVLIILALYLLVEQLLAA